MTVGIGRPVSGLVRLQDSQRTGSTDSTVRPQEEEVERSERPEGIAGLLGASREGGGGGGGTPLPPRFDRRSFEKRGDHTGQDGNLQKPNIKRSLGTTTKNSNNKSHSKQCHKQQQQKVR